MLLLNFTDKKSSGKDMKKKNVGTCPDMCPEKERYNREDKRQLSYYEMVPGTENIVCLFLYSRAGEQGVVAQSVACQLRKQRSSDQSTRPALSFVENNFPLPQIQEELVVSYW